MYDSGKKREVENQRISLGGCRLLFRHLKFILKMANKEHWKSVVGYGVLKRSQASFDVLFGITTLIIKTAK